MPTVHPGFIRDAAKRTAAALWVAIPRLWSEVGGCLPPNTHEGAGLHQPAFQPRRSLAGDYEEATRAPNCSPRGGLSRGSLAEMLIAPPICLPRRLDTFLPALAMPDK